jgi:hypothetical protein
MDVDDDPQAIADHARECAGYWFTVDGFLDVYSQAEADHLPTFTMDRETILGRMREAASARDHVRWCELAQHFLDTTSKSELLLWGRLLRAMTVAMKGAEISEDALHADALAACHRAIAAEMAAP